MQAELGFSPGSLSWIFNAYVIAFGGLLLGGRLSDLRRPAHLLGRLRQSTPVHLQIFCTRLFVLPHAFILNIRLSPRHKTRSG